LRASSRKVLSSIQLPIPWSRGLERRTWSVKLLVGTGGHWNGSIAEARFTFRVAKDLYSHGLSGYDVTETTRYMVARTTYYNWTVDGNITATWYNVNAYGKGLLIVVPVVIIVAAVLVIRLARKKTG
ncbi:MAG: hypothetical protein R6U10_00090, partial [Thermoplasmatota archaeon]